MRTRFANHGDLVEDLMVSHFPDGADDSTGYTYSEMLADTGILNFLQLNRQFIPEDAFTIGATPLYVKLYIDVPDTVLNNCIDCNEYNVNTNFRTIHIIEIPGSQISNYVQYHPPNNIFFTFGALDTSSNLFDNVIYPDSSSPILFNGFFPQQRYRMKTHYEICGMFEPTDLTVYQPINQQLQQLSIVNEQYLCGEQMDAATYLSKPDAPMNVANSVVLNQAFADSFKFWCTFLDGPFWLYADQNSNFSQYHTSDTNNCQKFIAIEGFSHTGGNLYRKLYPFEYRAPSFSVKSVSAFIPPGYIADTTATIQTSYTILGFNANAAVYTQPLDFQITQFDSTVFINVDSLINILGIFCLSDSTPFVTDSLLIGDNQLNYKIKINLISQNCNPGAFYDPRLEDLQVNFNDFDFSCIDSLNSVCNEIALSPDRQIDNDTLFTPDPNLSIVAAPPSIPAGVNQLCWTLAINNTNDVATNVYIAPLQVPYLSNWIIVNNGDTLLPDIPGIFHFDNNLQVSNLPLNVLLCANYDSCVVYDTIPLWYGWNCSGYPTSLNDSTLCFIDSTYIEFVDEAIDPTTGESQADTFDLCEPFMASGTLLEAALGTLYPFGVYLDQINPNLTILSVGLTNCYNPDTVFLTGSGPIWSVTDSILTVLNLDTFDLGSCLQVVLQLEATCGSVYYAGDTLNVPDIYFQFTTFCEDTLVKQARYSMLLPPDSKTTYSGFSHCNDCFTINKNAVQDTVFATDTVDYEIIICAYNALADTVYLTDYLPDNFVLTSIIPDTIPLLSVGCDTITVNGFYTLGGSCSDSSMINTAVINFGNDSLMDSGCMFVYPSCAIGITDIIPDSALASAYPGGFIGSSYFLTGDFIIDVDTFRILNSTVLVNAGAQIIVQQNNYLEVDSSIIEGCDQMWRGIYVDSVARLLINEHTIIKDAEIAVFARHKSTHRILNSHIIDCVRGFYVPPGFNIITQSIYGNEFGLFSASLKAPYDGQAPFGTLPMSGIEVNDVTLSLGVSTMDSNYFYNMNAGIVGFRSILRIINNKFENIQNDTFYPFAWNGTAIVSEGNRSIHSPGKLFVAPVSSLANTMDNCFRGVYTNYSLLEIINVKMVRLNTGIFSTECTDGLSSLVRGCYIEASDFGINWKVNAGATFMEATANQIIISGNELGIGINMDETSTAGIPNYNIQNNSRIDITAALCGIQARNVYNPKIIGNDIVQNSDIIQPPTYGIKLENDSSAYISCNTVVCTDSTYINSWGLHVTQSPGNFINCNSLDSMQIGVFFSGGCPDSRFTANYMRSNFRGLEIDETGIIGLQLEAGNRWIGYKDSVGAINFDTTGSNLAFSEFTVHTAMGASVFYPDIPSWNAGWFQTSGLTYRTCGFTCYPAIPDTVKDDQFRMSVADNSFETAEYNLESQLMAQQFLYNELSQDSLLLQSDIIYQDFFDEHKNGPVGLINRVLNNVKSHLKRDTGFYEQIVFLDSLVTLKISEIFELDSLAIVNLQMNYAASQLSLALDLQVLLDSVANLRNQYKLESESFLDSAIVSNNELLPTAFLQSNEKNVNSLYFMFIQHGRDTLTYYLSQLMAIAEQCPATGGSAVFRARTLVNLLNDSLQFDDLCGPQTRVGNPAAKVSSSKQTIIDVIPNPADLEITIKIKSNTLSNCQLEISDMLGNILLLSPINCGSKSAQIKTSNLTPGIYSVQVISDLEHSNVVKLIIAR